MRYISLFSGIEAATLAWKPLGWECAALAEIEPFPCALLQHYYPDIPNLGDVTKVTEEQIVALGHIDLVVFGFPCQDLSVAGKREGLKGERSGLFYDAMRIVRWSQARWAVAENVPGLFSSNEGRDFAAVVGEMAGVPIDVPSDGWRNAGVFFGQEALVEYAVLDSKHFRIAQRRRRVFLVRDTGDWQSRPPIFLESHCLQGHIAPSGEEGEETAGPIGQRINRSRTELDGHGAYISVSGDADARGSLELLSAFNETGQGWWTEDQAAATIRKGNLEGNGSARESTLVATWWDGQETAAHLTTRSVQQSMPDKGNLNAVIVPIAYGIDEEQNASEEMIGCLKARTDGGGFEGTVAYQMSIASHMAVRRLTPKECERLQGFPDNFTLIPYNGKLASDSVRYKSLGNTMTVNVMAHIGKKIQDAEDFAVVSL